MFYLIIALTIANCYLCIQPIALSIYLNRGRLFTYHNIFLLGTLHFQAIGMFQWASRRDEFDHWSWAIRDRKFATSLTFSLMLLTFLIVYRSLYSHFSKKSFGSSFSEQRAVFLEFLGTKQSVGISISLTFVAIVGWLTSLAIGQPQLGLMIAAGIGASATGFATWAACDRRNSVELWIFTFVTAFIHFVPHLTSYGRRGMMSIGLAVLWVMYLRFQSRVSNRKFVRIGLIVFLPFILALAAFSEVRVTWPKTTSEAVENLKRADLVRGVQRLAFLQNSSVISLWCIENHPRRFPYRPLNSLYALVTFPIPRAIWKEKPFGFGIAIPRWARMEGVGGLNVGAGLIGHVAHEGMWPTLFVYAVVFAFLIAKCDNWIRISHSPFILIPLGSALGELYAMARGEISYFAAILIISTTSGIVASVAASRFVAKYQR